MFKFADTQTNIEFGEEVDLDVEVKEPQQVDPMEAKFDSLLMKS